MAKIIKYLVKCRHCGAEYTHNKKAGQTPPGICGRCASRDIIVGRVIPGAEGAAKP